YSKQKINEDYLILLSIESLFKESGFKSAPPFYKAFKKFVGKTPKEYHNSINITDSVESENIKH
ncbi:helix-turn-helix domain-containing protein, partial [Flavobacteriaceae bacterium]|nr:helix-turn-helix domain-containing protein [Flavobacteriaceae bacterium]